MSNEIKIILPLWVGGRQRQKTDGTLTKPTKKFRMNLNMYRNWHHHTLNNTKKMFKEDVTPQLLKLPDISALWGEIHISYVVFQDTRRSYDVANVVAVADKYFCDALVEANKLEDDNCHILKGYSGFHGGMDKHNPRIEATITPFKGIT